MPDQPSEKTPSFFSNDLLRAIGLVAVNWSAIEAAMAVSICHLYEIPIGKALVLTSNLGFRSRLDILRVLARGDTIKAKREDENFLKILARIENVYGERNKYVHGLYGLGEDGLSAVRSAIRTTGGHLKPTRDPVSAGEVEASAARILEVGADFVELLKRIIPDLAPNT